MEKPFTITIEEKRSKDITIKAITRDEAVDMVEELYSYGDIRLTVDDVDDVDFLAYGDDTDEEE